MTHTVMATFQVRDGQTEALCALLDEHHAAIRGAGYGGGTKPIRLVRRTESGPLLFEIFDWVDGGVAMAAQDPVIVAVWRRIDALCEARNGMAPADFPAVDRLPVRE